MQDLTIANSVRAVRTDKYLQRDYSVQDFSEYTCFPTLRFEWCIYLFLSIDPRDFKRNCPRELDAFAKVLELAASSRSEGTFPCREGEISDLAAVRLSHTDFIQWAEVHIGIRAPEEWQPIGPEEQSAVGQIDGKSIHTLRREEVLGAAIEMLGCRVPSGQKDVLNFMRRSSEKHVACFTRRVSDETLMKSIRRAGGNVLKDTQYLRALRKTDKADKH